ncbi:MAG: radical SAM domain protein [Candidatus Desulfovibrio kirbyi]|uniref:Radical SAM domain protein n=1 Tax=Candidatus Desulfovibrio kirbyi TaxID=2696086 RepID=A0A6L2R718_9BACT|nr:MAG: radical SAM domain protein [Candidatus Desulfovibrio kirbyi]
MYWTLKKARGFNLMEDILLIEPNYANKYPPLGLMKISTFHKMLDDCVVFAKGTLPEQLEGKKWDRVYLSTLFTFEWEETKKSIQYALTVVKDERMVFVGGIMATLMSELFIETFPTITLIKGLLNRDGTLGLRGEKCIDRLTLDYDILDDIDYKYPATDAYFLYMTRGCGMKCQFCAVQTLEPEYVPYISIRDQIAEVDKRFGPKRNLLLMDNNVLRSNQFDKIVDELIELGFGKGSTYPSPRTGKPLHRHIDFNQGLDAKLMTEHKAKRLGELAITPARIAFDHIEDAKQYKKALELCAKNGIKSLSNYILYNGEDFTGKGQYYHADTPQDLFVRMKISMDFCDALNDKYGNDGRVHIFSFPMKYMPLNATDRSFVGTNWNKKYLRAIQRMLIPTQGKGVSSRSFFKADFGTTVEEFIENLAMPEDLLGLRGHFVERSTETKEDREKRYAKWKVNHARIDEWTRLYRSLGDDYTSYVELVKDNDFSIDTYWQASTPTLRKMLIHNLSYLCILRNIEVLGTEILTYIKVEFPSLYSELLRYVIHSEHTQFSCLKGMLILQGTIFISDIIRAFIEEPYLTTNVFDALYKAQKELKKVVFDTRCLSTAIRYKVTNAISDSEFRNIMRLGLEADEKKIEMRLYKKYKQIRETLREQNQDEIQEGIKSPIEHNGFIPLESTLPHIMNG